jgi:cytosine/adenosine deaminase-related metal-dependent hydrolase
MIRYLAEWVLPISRPPIRDGWVDVDGGRVAGVGGPEAVATIEHGSREVSLGRVALLPGLVNAHTHLELSYLRGRTARATEFVSWIRGVMAARRQRPDPASPEILEAIDLGIEEAVAAGTAAVGDISNTLVTIEPLAKSPLAALVFNELIRFKGDAAEAHVAEAVTRLGRLAPTASVKAGLAAHAPYSVAPAMFQAIRRHSQQGNRSPWSVHLSESRAETEFISSGTGPWRSLLEEVGSWDPSWAPTGTSPVQYLHRHGLIDAQMVAVHGVQMTSDDLRLLAAHDATLVACPRSNAYTGAGDPPIESFYASGVRVAVGTDSLASAPDLNLFSELAAMRSLAPGVPAAALLDSATRQGARALGLEGDLGTIETGRRARLLAVSIPPATDDVERYLVSGIQPEQIRWIP